MDSTTSTVDILKRHHLRNTDSRRDIIELFRSRTHALTHAFIEEHLGETYDRVTIYRTLKSFEDKGLIHRIADEGDSVLYALCTHAPHEHCHHDHDDNSHKHNDKHIHFKCEKCGHTYCLDEVLVPDVCLPEGYTAKGYQFLVIGNCKQCSREG